MISYRSVVDLTHALGERNPNYEGTLVSPFRAEPAGDLHRDGWFSRNFSMPEHFGTHLDAPAHFGEGVWTVDQIPAERLVAPLAVIDIAAQAANDRDYRLSVDDVHAYERAHGRIPPAAVVIARTGWEKRWSDMHDYRGADENQFVMSFPGFHLDAVRFLVEQRGAVGIGIDTMGVDYGQSADYAVHKFTAGKNVYHIENLANLDRLPEAGAYIVVAPIKLDGGSGGPARVLALVP